MAYAHRKLNKSNNTKGATSGAGTVFPFEPPEIIINVYWHSCICQPLFVFLPFFVVTIV